MTSQRLLTALLAMATFGVVPASGQLASLSFQQVDWDGLGIVQVDSSWGQVVVDHNGFPNTMFLNANVNGNWSIRNVPVDSYFGPGEPQQLMTFFDLNVPHGTPVNNLGVDFTLTPAPQPNMPNGPLNPAPVDDFVYAIGGLGEPEQAVLLDNFDPGADVTIVESVQLPFLELALKGPLNINQPLGRNDCCRGSVSNSLRYLQATRQIKATLPTDLDEVNDLVGKPLTDNRTRSDLGRKKAEAREAGAQGRSARRHRDDPHQKPSDRGEHVRFHGRGNR